MSKMREFDRLYDLGAYLCETNGFGAVFRPMPAERPPGKYGQPEKLVGSFAEWRSRILTEAKSLTLLEALAWPHCATCKDHRDVSCRDCQGNGMRHVTCDHCDESHDCPCSECDGSGRVACRDCNTISPIVIGGQWFDVRLVRRVVVTMGVGVDSPIAFGVSSTTSSGQWDVVFRSGEVFGVVMGAWFDRSREAPSWP